jgi:hypothetical protein
MARRYNVRRVKLHWSYSISEAAKLLGVHCAALLISSASKREARSESCRFTAQIVTVQERPVESFFEKSRLGPAIHTWEQLVRPVIPVIVLRTPKSECPLDFKKLILIPGLGESGAYRNALALMRESE